ncbi:MAG: NAD-binding protein [Muribaculaceae bacterium]|nr:NAD-binding protein [Roseburia sp.]MCM1431628.1 NAD-binding protein [Muribaculaceae bacterium]MCM1492093.1 NAD-binding protein [Muribaculaceae bacterium]
MAGNTAIFVTDARQRHIADYLSGRVCPVDWKRKYDEKKAGELLSSCDRIILPTPVSKIEKHAKIVKLLNEELTKERQTPLTVMGGSFSDSWVRNFKDKNILYYDLMKDENVAVRNARITAEATVAELLRYSDYSVLGQKIIVTGYGRCGREVANLLKAMGAKVTVLARNPKDRKRAQAEGHVAVDFSYGPEEVYGARSIINTVPALVLKEPMLKEMHPDTVILDIASRPGGTDLAAAEVHSIQVIPALGLPGIYTTKSSAKVLADAIGGYAHPEEEKKEGISWIFQIVI